MWFDALTPKQLLLTSSLASKLLKRGYEVLLTTRNYDYIVSLLKRLELKFKVEVLGEYGESLEDKLRVDLLRSIEILDLVKNWKPEVLISYPSPSSFRVAYGLKIPIVMLTDSPHSTVVNRLTIPLASALVVSEAIGVDWIEKFGGYNVKTYTYRGVDEVEYIRDFKPKPELLNELEVGKSKLYVLRPPEEKASYYKFQPLNLELLVRELLKRGKVIFFPRYESQRVWVKEKFKGKVLVPREALDTLSLYHYCEVVISGGASMAREAALLGVPSIYFFPEPLEVNVWLEKLGFPIHHFLNVKEILEFVDVELESIDREALKSRVKSLVRSLEGPSSVLEEAIRECTS